MGYLVGGGNIVSMEYVVVVFCGLCHLVFEGIALRTGRIRAWIYCVFTPYIDIIVGLHPGSLRKL